MPATKRSPDKTEGDMNEGLLSKRYAKALLECADSESVADELYPLMKKVAYGVIRTPQVRGLLDSPVISAEEKRKTVLDVIGAPVPELFGSFLDLVFRNRREHFLPEMALSYMSLYRRSRGIALVYLTSAQPLEESMVERIRRDVERRTGGKAEMNVRTDVSLQGGFIFQVDDVRLDASVRGQLDKIRREFIQNNRTIV